MNYIILQSFLKNAMDINNQETINFIKSAILFCRVIEQSADDTSKDFAKKLAGSLAGLYAATVDLPSYDEEYDYIDLECKVTEAMYNSVIQIVSDKLGAHDDFLTVDHVDMQYSDTPIVVHVSEDIADIYQDIVDMTHRIQRADNALMCAALKECVDHFHEFWGQCLTRSLGALHSYISAPDDEDED